MLYPAAIRNTLATTPMTMTWSAIPFSSTCRATSMESSTFVPPRTMQTGRGAPENTFERVKTSFSMRSPPAERMASGSPTTVG